MERPLIICIMSQEFPPHTNWGGIAVYSGALADALARRGHRVTVVSRANPGAPRLETLASGVMVHRVGAPIGRKRLVGRTVDRLLHARAVARAVRALDAAERFHVLETTEANFEGDVLLRDPAFARRMVIQCHGSNAFGQAAGGALAFAHRLDWSWSLRREFVGLARAPHVVVMSEATRGVLAAQGVQLGKVHLIPHGIDTDRFRPGDVRRPDTPLAVGFVGRLERRKGIDFVWRVVESLGPAPGVVFHLKGAVHPTSRDDTLSRLERHRDTVVHHLPGSHEAMPDFYRSLDVLLLPSRFENFGLAYAEAMATGLVVFAGVGGSAREVIRDRETGFLVDPDGSVKPVVEALRRMADDWDAFADMRRAARKDVIARFSLATCIVSKVALYRQIAE